MKDLENEIEIEQNKTPSRYTLYQRDPDKEFDYYDGTERLVDFLKIKDFSEEHYIDLVDHEMGFIKKYFLRMKYLYVVAFFINSCLYL